MSEAAPAAAGAGTRHLFRHTVWNLTGMCAPMLVALFAIPLLIKGLGTERFGLLSLVWMMVGYLGLFDLGLGRALTQTVGQRLGEGREREVPGIFWTALLLMTGMGALGGMLLWFAAPWLTFDALNIEPAFRPETLKAFRAVALALPLVISTSGLVGTLEAFRKFGLVNAIRVPTGAYTFIGPLLVLPFSRSLYAVVLALLAGRVAEWLIFFTASLATLPGARAGVRAERRHVPGLLTFGGWMTVANLVAPILLHIDRFLIGALRTVTEVAYYATPAEIVIKLLILPRAWVGVLFPAFAGGYRLRPDETAALFLRACRYLLAGLFPVMAAITALAPEFLSLWLGAEFGAASVPVLRLLAAGVFLHGLAFVPNALLQAVRRPDLTARIALFQLPLYLAFAALAIRHGGIAGAAAAWCVRALLDMLVTTSLAMRVIGRPLHPLRRSAVVALLDLAALALLSSPAPGWVRLAALLPVCGLHAAGCWFYLLEDGDRARLRDHARNARAQWDSIRSRNRRENHPS